MCLSFDTAPFYFQTRKEEIKSSYQYDILKNTFLKKRIFTLFMKTIITHNFQEKPKNCVHLQIQYSSVLPSETFTHLIAGFSSFYLSFLTL